LLESPCLRAWRVSHPSEVCVVTFANYRDSPSDPVQDVPGFGEAFLDGQRIDAIHVAGNGNDWFQYPEMPEALAAIRAAAGGRRLFTYGSSMGGYAAIRFAGALGAEGAIAISPQYSLDRRVVPSERRWRREAARLRFLPWPDPDPPGAVIFYDPCGPDGAHAGLWAAERPAVLVPLPHAGHPAGMFLLQAGLLGPAVLDILAGRFDRPALLRAARARRRQSGHYLAMLAGAQPPWRRRLAMRLLRAAMEAAPLMTLYPSRLAGMLYRAGEDTEAEHWHRHALALAPDDPALLFRLSLFLQRHGRLAEAGTLAAQASAWHPASATLARHATRLRRMQHALGPVRAALRGHNALMHRLTRLAWRRGWPNLGRVEQP